MPGAGDCPGRSLAQRPGQGATTKHVNMQMEDRLAGVRSVVREHPVAAVEEALDAGDLAGEQEEIGDQRGVIRPQIAQRRDVPARDHQDVRRRLRLGVPKGDGALVLGNEFDPERAARDPTEDAVRHRVRRHRRDPLAAVLPSRQIARSTDEVFPPSMPELPEVETVRRSLAELVVGRTIVAVRPRDFPGVMGDESIEAVAARLVGTRIDAARRRAKYVFLDLDDGSALMIHLRMTGHLVVTDRTDPPLRFEHLSIELDDGRDLRFADQRKFGRVLHLSAADASSLSGRLGPEPLSPRFTADLLHARLARRPGKLKSVLLDQRLVAGLGNIYVDEALFRARLHPERSASTLTGHEVRRLHRAIRTVLREGLVNRGTTFSTFQNAYGEAGGNQRNLRVYGRPGEPCVRCGRPLARAVVGGRGTHFCPRCQPLGILPADDPAVIDDERVLG